MESFVFIHGEKRSVRELLIKARCFSDSPKAIDVLVEYFTTKGDTFAAYFPSDDVQALLAKSELTLQKFMVELLPFAALYAITGVSHFNVGVVAQGKSGALYFGSNMEFNNTFIATSVHGEQSALCNAYIGHRDVPLINLAVNAPPCGHCRQFLSEYAENVNVVIYGRDSYPISHYLPDPFGPKDLEIEPFNSSLIPLEVSSVKAEKGSVDKSLLDVVVEKAKESFSPYSNSESAVAIKVKTNDGFKIFSGCYLEIAAYNPSLNPAESALILANQAGVALNEHTITEWAIAERVGGFSAVVQACSVFSAIAPNANYAVVRLVKG